MSETLFEMYEPHTDYVQAVILRPENFDQIAEEIGKTHEHLQLLVSKVLRYGEPFAIKIEAVDDPEQKFEPLTCRLHQCFIKRAGDQLRVCERHELRKEWRKVSSDPYRN